MRNIFKCVVVILFTICISSCGSSGGNGLVETVKVTATTKSSGSISTSLAVGTPGSFGSGTISYEVSSTAYSFLSGVVPSPVMVTKATISYLPMPDSANNPSPALPSFEKAIGIIVNAGSKGGVDDMLITSSTVVQYLYDNYVAIPSGSLNSGLQFRYVVSVVFSGYEINTGKSFTCDQVLSNMYVTK